MQTNKLANECVIQSEPHVSTQRDPWNDITALSQLMLELAHSENWNKLVELEELRSGMLAQAFATQHTSMQNQSADVAREVMAINQQIIVLSEERQQRCHTQLQALNAGRRAQQAYTESEL